MCIKVYCNQNTITDLYFSNFILNFIFHKKIRFKFFLKLRLIFLFMSIGSTSQSEGVPYHCNEIVRLSDQ